jgi:hypothetical protein
MFLLDDILLAPIKGLAAVCQKVHDAAQEDLQQQEKAVLAELAELYQLLESGRIADDAFDARECGLLDRLEACRKAKNKRRPLAKDNRNE